MEQASVCLWIRTAAEFLPAFGGRVVRIGGRRIWAKCVGCGGIGSGGARGANQDTSNLSQQEHAVAGADMATVATNYAQAQVVPRPQISAASQILQQKALLDYVA